MPVMGLKECICAAFIIASLISSFSLLYYCYSEGDVTLYSDIYEELCLNGTPSNPKSAENYSKSFFVLILVLSRPSALDRRNAIRNTWMKSFRERPEVLLKFSIGTEGLLKNLSRDIAQEQQNYGDLLLLPNLTESYSGLTNKVMRSLVEFNSRYRFDYLLKCDDDTFVVLGIILTELQIRRSKKHLYWGHMFKGAKVRQTGKFAESKYSRSEYLPYASGSAYILSGSLVGLISETSRSLTLYHNEDVSIGTWISSYDLERWDDKRFCAFYPGCDTFSIVYHPVTIRQIYMIQDKFKKLVAC